MSDIKITNPTHLSAAALLRAATDETDKARQLADDLSPVTEDFDRHVKLAETYAKIANVLAQGKGWV